MIDDLVTPKLEYRIAAKVVEVHFTKRCWVCGEDGCWLADWARRRVVQR